MKISHYISALLAIAFLLPVASIAQSSDNLSAQYKADAIASLNQLMIDFYVFPDVAEKTAKHLDKQLNEGHFDKYSDASSFAAALTESVQSINKDKHMRIRKNRPYVAQENTPQRMIEERIDRRNRSRSNNLGVNTVKILEGNVGYLDLRGFAGLERGKAKVDSYMQLMAETDAVIIDLSKNGGGSPRMVQYLCSYFFDKHVHLNSLYFREGDVTEEFWTLEEVGGKKLPDVPLFIITSNRTFSAAEEFSYNMQTRKRATLVGQTTGGGANPGGTRPINKDLSVFIPGGRAINPVTKTNWEGVGVIPEVKVEQDKAFEKASKLASAAAKEFRKTSDEKLTSDMKTLLSRLDNYSVSSNAKVNMLLERAVANRYLEEYNINALGYTYLMEHEKPEAAAAVFEANTKLFPNSPNVFDSYGEVLLLKGDVRGSIKNYMKAVEIAKSNEDPDLEMYKKNLEKAKSKMAGS